MDTFYIFGFGVISALVTVGVIYSVMVISKVNKKSEELEESAEDLQITINEFQRDIDNRVDQIYSDMDKRLTQVYMDLDTIRASIDSRFDKFDSRQRENYQTQLDSIYRDIDEMKRNSQALRESL